MATQLQLINISYHNIISYILVVVIVRKLEIDRVRTLALSFIRSCFYCFVESDLEIMRVLTE